MFEFRLLGGGETRWDDVKINNSGFISVTPYLLHRSLNQGMGMEGGGFFILGGGAFFCSSSRLKLCIVYSCFLMFNN